VFFLCDRDFTAFFNRLHTCRLFPPVWHTLTLHCGWQGPSTGGPHKIKLGELEGRRWVDYHACDPLLMCTCPLFLSSRSGGEPLLGTSSTWCCNPQFRITVQKATDVLVCLGQQDPRVANKRHVGKRMRRKKIGMQVRGKRLGRARWTCAFSLSDGTGFFLDL